MSNVIVREQFEALNAQLIEARKTVQERDRILSLMASIDRQLSERRRELSLFVTQLKYEKQDVTALEGLSLEAIFYTLLGRKEEQLEKETAEYLNLKMATEKCRLTIASLEHQLHQFEADLVVLADCDDAYATLQQLQLQMLMALDRPESSQLRHLLYLQEELHKFERTYQTGQKANEMINKMISILVSGFNRESVTKAMKLADSSQEVVDQFCDELVQISQHPLNFPPVIPSFRTNPVPTLGERILTELFWDIFKENYKPQLQKWLTQLRLLRDRIKNKMVLVEYKLLSLNVSSKRLEMETRFLIEQLWQPEYFAVI